MEYRGYDSSGVAILDGSGSSRVEKKEGKLANLEAALDAAGRDGFPGTTGIGRASCRERVSFLV